MDLSRDYDTDESEAEVSQPTPKKRKQYKQKYNHSWEKDPQLKQWIMAVKSDPCKTLALSITLLSFCS